MLNARSSSRAVLAVKKKFSPTRVAVRPLPKIKDFGDPYCARVRIVPRQNKKTVHKCVLSFVGGGQEIRTLAPVSRPTPLAGEPLWPLE